MAERSLKYFDTYTRLWTDFGPGDTIPASVVPAGGGGSSDTWLQLASDNTVSTTALADVTGLSFEADAGTTYLVKLFGAFQTAATTTGIGLALAIPSGSVIGMAIANNSNTATQTSIQRADNAVIAPTTAVPAANTNIPISGWWIVAIGGTGGTVQLRQRSEIAASNTVLKAGITLLGYRVLIAP